MVTVPGRGAERVFDTLLGAARPLQVGELASLVGLHPTTVRQHLVHLAERGTVVIEPIHREGRGRPRLAYRAVDVEDAYRFLSAALAEAVRDGVGAREVGQRAGRRAAATDGGADAVSVLAAEARRLGFRPDVRSTGHRIEVLLGPCPFADVAVTEPEVVCELHLGVAEGIVAATGGMTVEGMRIASPDQGGCAVCLVPTHPG